MKAFSRNTKLNKALSGIYNDLLSISDTETLSRNEVKRYVKAFSRESDHNIAQYGNVLIYYYQVRDFYKNCGYKSMEKMSDAKIWDIYKRQVGYVARIIAADLF